jgi:transcriptional regulator with XRE-family HTH domain
MKHELREWMKAHGMSLRSAAELFQVEKQTIANWRSSGVPERRRPHVRLVIAENPPCGRTGRPQGVQQLTIHATREQFRRWNLAALSQSPPMLIEDWAIESLDRLASDWIRERKL